MTTEEFMGLPLLLTPAQAMAVLNLNRNKLRELRVKGLVVVLPGQRMRRYRKSVLARLAGISVGS